MKDLGGGGLSCVIGEMALAAGYAAEVDLEKAPLKEEGLVPWEIWVSESQERMMLAVTQENLEDVLQIFDKWDVESTVLARVIPGEKLRVNWHGENIFEMNLNFLTGGPVYDRPFCVRQSWLPPGTPVVGKRDCIIPGPTGSGDEILGPCPEDLKQIVLRLLGSINIASRDWAIRQYDHEVRASTVVNPLQGVPFHETHGDASVIKPLKNSWKGLALTVDVNPSLVELSPYWGSCSALDEVCRNLVAVGARPHSLADCLNFGNPEKEERMGEFYESCRGLGDLAKALGIPYVSGNVSFYNETMGLTIPPTPTLLGVGLVDDVRKSTTTDLKSSDSDLYLIGTTREELDGSEYFRMMGWSATAVPAVDFENLKNSIELVLDAQRSGLLKACHDISEGGLAVAAAEMCIGGRLGAEIHLDKIDSGINRNDYKLFSESNTRWLAEVTQADSAEFETILGSKLNITKIGDTGGSELSFKGLDRDLSIGLDELEANWKNGLWNFLG
jgi:phosphoribosylformylglycinamidine synthase